MKKVLNTIGFLIVLSSMSNLLAQRDTTPFHNRTSLLLSFAGQEWVSIYGNFYINNRVSVNAAFGIISDAHLGVNYYLLKRHKHYGSFYIGAQIANFSQFLLFSDANERQTGFYFPLGFEYIDRRGLTFQIDVGPNSVATREWGQHNTRPILLSVKLGKTFKAKRKTVL